MRGAFWFMLILLMLAIVCSPAAAGADQLKVNFESGPPLGSAVDDDYLERVRSLLPERSRGWIPSVPTVGARACALWECRGRRRR